MVTIPTYSKKSLQKNLIASSSTRNLMIGTESVSHFDETSSIGTNMSDSENDENLFIADDDRIKDEEANDTDEKYLDNESINGSLATSSTYMDVDYLDEYHDIIIQHTNNVSCNKIFLLHL